MQSEAAAAKSAANRAAAASSLPRGDAGATMVEYGLMVALVAVVAFLAVTAFGISVNDLIDNVDLLNALS